MRALRARGGATDFSLALGTLDCSLPQPAFLGISWQSPSGGGAEGQGRGAQHHTQTRHSRLHHYAPETHPQAHGTQAAERESDPG